jgi:Domain of unknown function (DUF3395)
MEDDVPAKDDDYDDDRDDQGRRIRTRNRPLVDPNDDGLSNNNKNNVASQLAATGMDPILAEHLGRVKEAWTLDKNRKNTDEERKKKNTSGPLPDPYEQTRNINKVILEIPLVIQYPSGGPPSSMSTKHNFKQQQNEKNEKQQDAPQQQPTAILMMMPQWKTLSQNAQCSMHCFVPPSTPQGRWTGSITGSTSVFQAAGTATGTANVTCKVTSNCRLMAGCTLTTLNDSRPLQLHCGALVKSSGTPTKQHQQSTVQLSLRQRPKNKWNASLVARKVFDPWILTCTLGWYNKSDTKAMVSISSMTTHVLKVGFGWAGRANNNNNNNITSLSSSSILQLPMMQLMIDPKLSSNRRLPVSFQYQPVNNTWSATATLQTSRPIKKNSTTSSSSTNVAALRDGPTSTPASWRVGVQGGTALQFRWSIVVAWQYGDITVRIPIILGTAATLFRRQPLQQDTNDNNQQQQNSLVATIIPFVAIVIIGMANEMLSRMFWNPSGGAEESVAAATIKSSTDDDDVAATTNGQPKKEKQDAATQQRLMRRQAELRTAAELEKNGLVIQSAIYEFGGDDVNTESWDVTIPLQFWVQNETSTLQLAVGSKQHLLGFYPLSSPPMDNNISSSDSGSKDAVLHDKREENRVPWWQEYWTPTTRRSKQTTSQAKNPVSKPKLTVKYSYEGNDFEKEVKDDEGLILPHADDIGAKNKDTPMG